jgi:hypothetical protein
MKSLVFLVFGLIVFPIVKAHSGQLGQPILSLVHDARWEASASHWSESARLWKLVTASNPVNGSYWSSLGDALMQARDYSSASSAFERAEALGDGFPSESRYRIAQCNALLGREEAALEDLRTAFAMGYRDSIGPGQEEAFKKLRGKKAFIDLLALADTSGAYGVFGWGERRVRVEPGAKILFV